MKLSEILTEARTDAILFKIAVKDASKVVANATGEMYFNTTLFQKSYIQRDSSDEIVEFAKQTNITKLKNCIKNHCDLIMIIRIGKLSYEGIIEIDE